MAKHTTIDQLKMLAQRSKSEIDKVDVKVTALSSRVDGLVTAGGEPNVINNIKYNGNNSPITDKAVDIGASIASAVAGSDHLTRKIVTGVDAIDPVAEDAEKYIYMVPKTGSDEDDQYDEYMVLEGKVEHVGNTKVDLSNYITKDEIATDAEVDAMLTEVFGPAEQSDAPAE